MQRPGPPLRRARAFIAVMAVIQLAFLAYAAWAFWPDAQEGIGRRIVIQPGGEPDGGPGAGHGGDPTGGIVVLQLAGPPAPDDAVWRIERADGQVTVLSGTAPAWDTRTGPNGIYLATVEVDGGLVARREIEVQNARTDPATAVAVVGTATAVVAGGSAVTSSVAGRLSVAVIQVGKETALALGEDHMKLRTAGRRRHMPGVVALAITLGMVFLFFALEGLEHLAWSDYLDALPVAGGVSAVFVALALGAEAALAFAGRAASRVRFLTSGAVSLIISSIAFRTPFGFPGFVEEDDDADADGAADQPPHVEAVRALASLLVLGGLLLPFLWLGRLDARVADQATEIALVTLATGALPIKPMPGYDIWRWRRLPAFVLAVVAYTLFFGFELGFLRTWWLLALGWLGVLVYAATFAWLRGRTADPPSPLYLAFVAAGGQLRQAGAVLAPRSWVAALRHLARAGARTAGAMDRAVAAVARAMQRAAAPMARRLATREQRRADAAVREARERFIHDAEAFLRGMETLPDETQVSTPATQVRLGDIRRDLLRERLAAALGPDAPAVVTAGGHSIEMR